MDAVLEPEYERVYTMTDYYDGPRKGIADFEGRPHLYEAEWDDVQLISRPDQVSSLLFGRKAHFEQLAAGPELLMKQDQFQQGKRGARRFTALRVTSRPDGNPVKRHVVHRNQERVRFRGRIANAAIPSRQEPIPDHLLRLLRVPGNPTQ